MIARFFTTRDGGTAIEYAMIASLIAILLVTALSGIGIRIEDIFGDVASGFTGVAP